MERVKIIHTCKAPDGTVLKRTTAGRRYSHAVIGKSRRGRDNGAWVIFACCGRLDLAHKAAAGYSGDVQIVPMEADEREVKAKPAVAFPGDAFETDGLQFALVDNGHYKIMRAKLGDWTIELHKYSADFGASAWIATDRWNSSVHTGKSPKLENVVAKIKQLIEAKTAKLAEAAQ